MEWLVTVECMFCDMWVGNAEPLPCVWQSIANMGRTVLWWEHRGMAGLWAPMSSWVKLELTLKLLIRNSKNFVDGMQMFSKSSSPRGENCLSSDIRINRYNKYLYRACFFIPTFSWWLVVYMASNCLVAQLPANHKLCQVKWNTVYSHTQMVNDNHAMITATILCWQLSLGKNNFNRISHW